MEFAEKRMDTALSALLADYRQGRDIDRTQLLHYPDKNAVIMLVEKLHRLMFPGYFREVSSADQDISGLVEDAFCDLRRQAANVLNNEQAGEAICLAFLEKLPAIRALLQTDLQAAYNGDPAATSKEEIILSYPGLKAITVYRLAHGLQQLNLPMIPRMMTEYAHSITGIDIHPGAIIGSGFFIDHGTGIVIGETAVIGNHVKIYQGVTLGGLSTRGGQSLRGKRRHPTIEDNVTIYANATILGGDTIVGRDCVIGSSVFITESVAPGTTVTNQSQQLQFRTHRK